jgi:thienamycin biosynthesis protein ThnN
MTTATERESSRVHQNPGSPTRVPANAATERQDHVAVGTQPDERLRELLALHFHPEYGSRYWLRRQNELGWLVCDYVRQLDDLWSLGPTSLGDLRRYPLTDFIPQSFHRQLRRFVIGETAGTSGRPCATAYRDDEFQAAFVTPFLKVAEATGFPEEAAWLWIGPSGPHIIGKVVRELARQTGGMDPFSVDFDPRWAKRLVEGSLARQRYLDHVTDQALDVLEREAIDVLFTTPPALAALAHRLTDCQREVIRGVHYGGLCMSAMVLNEFREMFPNAVHLVGYGNTLFGVLMEVTDRPRLALNYFPLEQRLQCVVVDGADAAWPPRPVGPGETGRVAFHRLDESCLLVGIVERDEAERVSAPPEAVALGCIGDGLRNPRPPASLGGKLQTGIY